jgi:hypothetical protein
VFIVVVSLAVALMVAVTFMPARKARMSAEERVALETAEFPLGG